MKEAPTAVKSQSNQQNFTKKDSKHLGEISPPLQKSQSAPRKSEEQNGEKTEKRTNEQTTSKKPMNKQVQIYDSLAKEKDSAQKKERTNKPRVEDEDNDNDNVDP